MSTGAHAHAGGGTHRSLLSRSGCSSLSRAVSVCMNLLNGVSFFRPPEDEDLPGGARVSGAADRGGGALTLLGRRVCAVVGGVGRRRLGRGGHHGGGGAAVCGASASCLGRGRAGSLTVRGWGAGRCGGWDGGGRSEEARHVEGSL